MKKVQIIKKLKSIGKYYIFILGVIGTLVLFYYGNIIPNLVLIIQFWTIITVYIVLAIQFKSEKFWWLNRTFSLNRFYSILWSRNINPSTKLHSFLVDFNRRNSPSFF